MTNYYTEWSFIISGATPDEAAWLQEKNEESSECGVGMVEYYSEKNEIHIYNEGGEGDADELSEILKEFLKKFPVRKCLGFEVALFCDKSRPDGFGGGAYFVTPENIEYMGTEDWLESKIADFEDEISYGLDDYTNNMIHRTDDNADK